jgi:hypothetical protein
MNSSSVAIALVFLSACAAPVTQAPDPETLRPPAVEEEAPPPTLAVTAAAPTPPPATCTMFAKPGVVHRQALTHLIDAGLPRWMQGVEGDRALANHRFQGWLIKSLYPDDPCYRDIGLLPGDIVQKVNGKSIEKPEQAFDVAESLRTAPAIVVDFLRNGSAKSITIAVAND